MTVYIVLACQYSGDTIIGVYATREAAEASIKDRYLVKYEIEEWSVE